MKNHLTEDILIEYQFDLMDVSQRPEVEAHLKSCSTCQAAYQSLQRKFSALNSLQEESPVPDALLQKTRAAVGIKPKSSAAYRLWPYLSSAAAAVIVLGLVISSLVTPPKNTVSNESVPSDPASQSSGIGNVMVTKAASDSDEKIRIVSADNIPDKPPFAPASAIELVVVPNPDKMQVTIYNEADLTMIRDTRKLTLKAGWNWLQWMWADTKIDPTSLSLEPLEYKDHIDIQQLVYPAHLNNIGRWLIRSEVEGSVSFEITYFTSGLTWRALYEGTLTPDEKTLQLKGSVRVQNNSGQDYDNAQTRLVIGKTHLLDTISNLAGIKAFSSYGIRRGSTVLGITHEGVESFDRSGRDLNGDQWYFYDNDSTVQREKYIAKEGLSDYFLYTIEGTEDLKNQWAKRLPSMEAENIPVISLNKYDPERYGDQTVRFVTFTNDPNHKLGSVPLPEGNVALFRQVDTDKSLSYVGRTSMKYIPVNEDVEWNLGTDLLVNVKPILMDSRTDNYLFDQKGDIAGWDEIETWQITIINTRDIPVKLEITRNINSDLWDLKLLDKQAAEAPAIDYTKHDVQHARFSLQLAEHSAREINYQVTKYIGTRKEIKTQQLQKINKEK